MMAVYEYTAKHEDGSRFSGVYSDVSGTAMLREELSRMGDTLLKAKRRRSESGKHARISQAEVVTFTYRFAAMCSAGLSIVRSLETLEQQCENRLLKCVISDVKQSVATGSSMKDAFEKHRNVFSDFFLGMVEAGEASGKLPETLEMSASYLEKRIDFRRKLRSAFAYPVIVGIISFVVVSILVVFVVPVFSKLYEQLHVQLPVSTQALISLSLLFRNWGWVLLLPAIGMVLLLKKFSKVPYLKNRWDTFKLNMPLFAKLNRMAVVSQFIRTFAMLVEAGVPLIKALDVASIVVHNSRLAEIATQLQELIRAGHPVADSLQKYELFPPMVIQLAASGEESGTLSEMLRKGADFLDKDIDRIIKALIVKIEPAMTVIMGIIIGLILMSVYMPMFDYMAHVQ